MSQSELRHSSLSSHDWLINPALSNPLCSPGNAGEQDEWKRRSGRAKTFSLAVSPHRLPRFCFLSHCLSLLWMRPVLVGAPAASSAAGSCWRSSSRLFRVCRDVVCTVINMQDAHTSSTNCQSYASLPL